LIYATQFTQVITVTLELAYFKYLESIQQLQADCIFAGHSLGEYGALCCHLEALTLEGVLKITFLRGITMQNAVQRDKYGNSPYRMVSISPNRIGKTVKDLNLLLEDAQQNDLFVQIVNYNIRDQQYIIAGQMSDIHSVINQFEGTNTTFSGKLQRTRCSIPLAGIDVPFHSKLLYPMVEQFRQLLRKECFPNGRLEYQVLENRYIPNLVGQYFQLSKEFVQQCLEYCSSDVLKQLLQDWDSLDNQVKACTILIELLAYQFASPVQWIKTQDLLMESIDYFIEIGPSPVLVNMMKKSSDNRIKTEFCQHI
jgi:fatty acid synthase